MRSITFVLMLIVTYSYGQVDPDSLDYWKSAYNLEQVTYTEAQAGINGYLQRTDYQVNGKIKAIKRSEYFWNNRLDFSPNAKDYSETLTRALAVYHEHSICDDNDIAEWEYAGRPVQDPIHAGINPGLSHSAGIITAVYMNPSNHQSIVIGSGASGIWKTTNGGDDWYSVTEDMRIPGLGINEIIDVSPPDQEGRLLLAVSGVDKFYESYGIGILRSSDFGETWTPLDLPEVGGRIPSIIEIDAKKGLSPNLYACSRRNVFKSSDYGDSWTILPLPASFNVATSERFFDLEVNNIDNVIYLSSTVGADVPTAHLWKSTSGGTTWTDITSNVQEGAAAFDGHHVSMFENFTTDFGDLTPFPAYGTLPVIEDFGVLGAHVEINPVEVDGEWTSNQPWMRYSLLPDYLEKEGTVTFSFSAYLPAHTEVMLAFVGGYADPIHVLTTETSDYFTVDPTTIDVPDIFPGGLYGVDIRFKFNEDYDIADGPIYFDNFQMDLDYDPAPLPSLGIDIGDAEYGKVYVMNSGKNKKKHLLYSSNYGNTWEGLHRGTGSPGTRSTLTCGYGVEKGVYFGTVKMNIFNFETGNFITTHTEHDDVRNIQIVDAADDGNRIVAGDDGGVSYSEDGGMTWTSLNSDFLPITEYYSIGISDLNSEVLIGGAQDNGTFRKDVETGWFHNSGGDGGTCGYFNTNPEQFFYQVNSRTTVKSGPGPFAIYSFTAGSSNALSWFLGRPTVVDPNDDNLLFEGYAKYYKNNDGEITERPNASIVTHDIAADVFSIYDFPEGTHRIGAIEINEKNSHFIYAAEGSNTPGANLKKLFLSVNHGTSYYDITNASTNQIIKEGGASFTDHYFHQVLSYKHINAIETDPENEQKLWVGLSGIDYTDDETAGRFRVLVSSNAGAMWTDYSKGLPPFPVNDLIYHKGSNDLMFAATDVGVYYRDASMDSWLCFQMGMPTCIVTNLEINNCTQELYAGTFGRGIWKTDLDFDNVSFLSVDEDETWSDVRRYNTDIVVESGVKLTITGTVKMGQQKKIIIKQGGELYLNGGTLTNSCGGFWRGIEVWGETALSQFGNNQGELKMRNGALIENAEEAVTLWKRGYWGKTGGIITAHHSTFRNNRKDVGFVYYSNDHLGNHYANKATFHNVHFIWDDDFGSEVPLGHVTLYKVDGVRFQGCTFEDARTAPTPSDNNVGIQSIDAHYIVRAYCTNFDLDPCGDDIYDPEWDATRFNNLQIGIRAANISTLQAIVVDRCIFNETSTGIRLTGIDNPQVTRNQFDWDAPVADESIGIHAIDTEGILFEENSFELSSPSTKRTIGIICQNLGETNQEIYKNEFKSLNWGIVTLGKNRSSTTDIPGAEGLEFLCNTNESNDMDHLVIGVIFGTGPPEYGVKENNGSYLDPSGNTLSILEGDESNYKNFTSNLVYYWHKPVNTPENTIGVVPYETPQDNECPTQLIGHDGAVLRLAQQDKAQYLNRFYSMSQQLQTKENEYAERSLDANETANVLNAIANLSPNSAPSLHQQLRNFSPYLTLEIMYALGNHSASVYLHQWYKELIMANIDLARDDHFMAFLSTKPSPMPNQMIQQIVSAAEQMISDRVKLKAEIGQLYGKRAFYINRLLIDEKHDSLGVDSDQLRFLINEKDGVMKAQQIVDAYLKDEHYASANAELNSLQAQLQNYPAHLQAELSDFIALKGQLIPILSQTGKIANLADNDLDLIRQMAQNGSGKAQYQAQSLLCFFYGECEFEETQYPLNRSVASQEEQLEAQAEDQHVAAEQPFSLSPNPGDEIVEIKLGLSEFGQAEVTITDAQGKLLLQQTFSSDTFIWNTRAVQQGLYIVSLRVDGKLLGVEKAIIQH